MRVLGLPHLPELPAAHGEDLGALVGPALGLARGVAVALEGLVGVAVVEGLLVEVALVVLHEKGALVVVLLHEHHLRARLLALAHLLVLGNDLRVRHPAPPLYFQLLALVHLPLLLVALDALQLAQPPPVVLLLLVALRVGVLARRALRPRHHRLLLLHQLLRHHLPRLQLPRLGALLLGHLLRLVLCVDARALLHGGAARLRHEHGLHQLPLVLPFALRLVLP
mmetsp:Transcript_26892/g.64178  ORF Transcript_26892/g.64178 Transcript_26892/m.64178 type:complete len:224 (-) Transcript_26892:422-1093(-)